MAARGLAEFEDLVRRCGLPLVGLDEPAPFPRMLGDASHTVDASATDGAVEGLCLAYGDPMRAEGPLVQVITARWGEPADAPDLSDLLEDELDKAEDETPVEEAVERAELVVDGEPRPAVVQRAGTRFWAARCDYRDAEVTVVARDWDLGSTRLVCVPDVEPFLRATREYIQALLAAAEPVPVEPEEPGEVDVEHAHRALVEATLEEAREVHARVREGRRPRIRGVSRAAELWEGAVRAQMRLADQTRAVADESITAMVNQLTALQEEAPWFADERPRAAAITETLLFWTGLREAVPSRAAQQAWQREWAQLSAHPGDLFAAAERPSPERDATLRRRFADLPSNHKAWLEAWAGWARSQRGGPGRA